MAIYKGTNAYEELIQTLGRLAFMGSDADLDIRIRKGRITGWTAVGKNAILFEGRKPRRLSPRKKK